MHSVAMDYFDGAWRGYHMLREQGLQRIGMVILPESQIRTGYRWLGGASTAAASMGEQLWHYPGTLLTDNEYARWLRAHQIEGVLTIHPSTLDLTRKHVRQIWFLNDWSAESKQANAVLSIPPQSIGREGVRFIHHLLLRREYGLPAQPHTVTVRGVWQTRS